jgi:hypothetical protein
MTPGVAEIDLHAGALRSRARYREADDIRALVAPLMRLAAPGPSRETGLSYESSVAVRVPSPLACVL